MKMLSYLTYCLVILVISSSIPQTTATHNYKLIYYDSRGTTEISRLLFAYAGIYYEDVRIPDTDWPDIRDMPMGRVPALEIDGKIFGQGAAIARYLATEFGLMGKGPLDALRIDELHWTLTELYQLFFKAFLGKEVELLKTFEEKTLPKYCTFFESRLSENEEGNGFYVGNRLSLADILLFNFMETMKLATFTCPKLQDLHAKVAGISQIAEWIKKRPSSVW